MSDGQTTDRTRQMQSSAAEALPRSTIDPAPVRGAVSRTKLTSSSSQTHTQRTQTCG